MIDLTHPDIDPVARQRLLDAVRAGDGAPVLGAHVFPLSDPRFDALRGRLLAAVRSGQTQLVSDYANAIAVEADKFGLLNGCGRADIVDAAMDHVATALELDKRAAADEEPNKPVLPVELDLVALAGSEPQPPAFIVKDWLPQGEVTLFAGHGGTGKSMIALTLAACIASGRRFFGMDTKQRRTAFLSLEDAAPVQHWRLARICSWLGVGMDQLAGQLVLWDGTDSEAALMTETRDGVQLTHVYEWLRHRMDGVQVLVIDGASDAFDANENQRAPVRRFIRALRQLIPADGAIVLLAHVDKGSAKFADTSQGYSGSTAWSNSVRARWYLRKERDDDDGLLLEVQKSNLAAAGHSLRIRWNEEARVFVGELSMPVSKLDRELAEYDEREAILKLIRAADDSGDPIPAATGGPRTCWHVLSAQAGCPEALKRPGEGRKRLFQAIESLRAAGAVRADTVKSSGRNTKEVLRAA